MTQNQHRRGAAWAAGLLALAGSSSDAVGGWGGPDLAPCLIPATTKARETKQQRAARVAKKRARKAARKARRAQR